MVSQEKPLVSVIMSAYNAGRYIAQAIKGILNQTYPNIELIIVDANSSDNTAEIIKRFARIDRRVKPIFLNRRITIAKARNIAIKNAKGQFYATADADDISVSSRIKKQVIFLKKYKDCQICGTWYTKTERPETGQGGLVRYLPWLPEDIENELHIHNAIGGASNFIRAEVFHKLGGYNEDLKIGEDWDLHIRAIKNGMEIRVIPEVLVLYRMHPDSMIHIVPPTPWKNPLKLVSPWDAKVSASLFDVPLNKLYDVQSKWINDKLVKFIDSKKTILWRGPRAPIYVPYFIKWAMKRNVKIAGIAGINCYYCGLDPIKINDIKKYLGRGYKVVICDSDKTRVDASMFLESLGAKAWKDYICVVPYLTRLAEIETAKKYVEWERKNR